MVLYLFAPVSGGAISMRLMISDDYSQTGDLSVVLSASVFRARSPLPGVFFGNGAAVTSVVGTMRHIGGVSAVLAGVRQGLTGRVMPDGIFSVSASARGNDDYVLRLYSALKSHGAFVATLIAGDAGGVYDPVSAIFSVLASAHIRRSVVYRRQVAAVMLQTIAVMFWRLWIMIWIPGRCARVSGNCNLLTIVPYCLMTR